MKYISKSEKDTYNLGFSLASKLKEGSVVAFYGELGVGKTAFTKGICAYFKIYDVHSPTFTIVNEYNGERVVYHFDAYRIDDDAFLNGGFDEYLYMDAVCIIEWAENLKTVLPDDTVKIKISRDISKGDDYRIIEISD